MTTKQTVSTGKSSKKSPQQAVKSLPEVDRHQMIAEAAYYHAEHRGFQGGSVEEDWLIAETEIDNMLSNEMEPRKKH